MAIPAIETHYDGCRFRSRTEARWAVFLNHLGVRWEYEIDGFNLPSGCYLPDFWLKNVGRPDRDGVWFEVKGTPDRADDDRWGDLVIGTKRPLCVASELPKVDSDGALRYEAPDAHLVRLEYFEYPDGSPDVAGEEGLDFCVCPHCSRIGIEFSGGYPERFCVHPGAADSDGSIHPRVVAAYVAARSARFEHGETPIQGGAR